MRAIVEKPNTIRQPVRCLGRLSGERTCIMRKIRWGVISTARIGTEKVIPAMQRGELCEVTAIASRDGAKAKLAAEKLGIAKTYD